MDSPTSLLPPKREVVLSFLGRGTLRVFVDARRAGVTVPRGLSQQAELVLRVGYALNPPIPDLDIGADAIGCTLSFNRVPAWCRLPYEAIYAIVSDSDGRGVVWPDDVPIESQILQSAAPRPSSRPERSGRRPSTPRAEPKRPSQPPARTTSNKPKRDAAPRPTVETIVAASGAPDRVSDADVPHANIPRAAVRSQALSSQHAASPSSSPPPSKPKRELPPYLRVVK
jgi:stringent starvation protein B